MFNSFHLQSECCPNYINLIPSLSIFNRSVFNIYLITKPLGSCHIPCSSYLTECFQVRSTPLCSFFQLFNLSRFMVSLVCQRSNIVLPLSSSSSAFLRCHP